MSYQIFFFLIFYVEMMHIFLIPIKYMVKAKVKVYIGINGSPLHSKLYAVWK